MCGTVLIVFLFLARFHSLGCIFQYRYSFFGRFRLRDTTFRHESIDRTEDGINKYKSDIVSMSNGLDEKDTLIDSSDRTKDA